MRRERRSVVQVVVLPGDGNALIAAMRNGDVEVVRLLLEAGADPTLYVPGDETALTAAADAGDVELMRLMLDAAESR